MIALDRHAYYNKYKRDKKSKQFYNSKAWEVCRTNVLIKYYYLCKECLDNKTIKVYDVVHHIKPLRDYPKLALVESNLIPLCHACHNRMENDIKNNEKEENRRINVVEFGANEEIT